MALGYHYKDFIRCNPQRQQSHINHLTQTHHTVGRMNAQRELIDWSASCQKLESILGDSDVGVLVVGHGTRNPLGSAQLLRLVDHIRALLPMGRIAGCFLELAEPDIAAGVQELKGMGCSSLIVVPVLLFTAAHAKTDIPDAVAVHAKQLGLRVLGQTPSLGTHPRVLELSKNRFDEVVNLPKGAICPDGGCADGSHPRERCNVYQNCSVRCTLLNWLESRQSRSEHPFGKVALAMVGRGTSDVAALEQMRELTRLRVQMAKVGAHSDLIHWSETGFFAGGVPTVDELFERASRSGCDSVIVQPHLLFEGELMDQLREKIRSRRQNDSGPTWWITRSLGADPNLAEVFVGLLMDQSAEW